MVNESEPSMRLRDYRITGMMVYTVILGHRQGITPFPCEFGGRHSPNKGHQRPRSKEGTVSNHNSKVWNMITPMRSGIPSKPTVRAAEFLSGSRRAQEAKASSRKATGIHNRLDREYPARKGAD